MSDEQPDGQEQAVATWRKDGRCSSCVYFETDYGAEPDFYGHCKMYPRTGSRESSDWACGEYGPLDGFDRLTKSTSRELDIALAKEKARKNPPPVRQQGIRRRVVEDSSAQRSGSVVRRSPVNSMPSMADLMAQRGQSAPEVRTPAPAAPRAQAPVYASTQPPSSPPRGPAVARPAPPAPRPVVAHPGGITMSPDDLRDVLLEVIQSAMAVEEIDLATRWEDGSLILEPANPDQQPVVIPIETFWNKIIMVRDRLRVLEQKLNSSENLSNAEKVDMQQYISRCYGSLTTFNVLFKNREDRFSSK